MGERDDLRKQDPASPQLSTINDEISKATSDHNRRQWREFVESIEHRTDSIKLWRTIKGIYDRHETGFNRMKPSHRTVCVTIDLTTAFDTVSHDILISKIAGSSLPHTTTRWLSCFLRGRQAANSFRGIKSRIHVVTFTVQLLYSWYANSPGQECLLCWRHHNLGFWTKDPTAGVHDQQLTERCRHLPEETLAFDLCSEVNSHDLHPGHTPVPDASIYYSWRYTTTTRAQPKNTGSDYGSILILPQTLQLRDR